MITGSMPIEQFMTSCPHTIGAEQSLARAKAVMREHDIRHLPVLHGVRLVGVVTDRDVHLIETLEDVDPQLVTVSDAMATEVYSVAPGAHLEEVVAKMAEQKFGSAIVMQGQQVVGIFTTVDACKALASFLRGAPSR